MFTTADSEAYPDENSNGIPDDQEIDDSNLDLDGNGVSDVLQHDIRCLNTVIGDSQIGLKCHSGLDVEQIKSIDPDSIADKENKPDDIAFGLISFKVKVAEPGDTAYVTVYLSEPAPAEANWYRYDTTNGWYPYSHATFRGDDRSMVDLVLKDGGPDYGDVDGAKNGVIIDTSGVGALTQTEPKPSGGGGGGGGCFIGTASSWIY